MPPTVRLSLILHNHQPVGNFDGVIEQAYQDSYLPFLDVYEQYPSLKIALHTSGPLMEWLDANHPEYLDRLARLVSEQRIEIVGGPFYEPILTMIPPQDRRGQIMAYTQWLEGRLGAKVSGMWMPERVWEQSLVSDLAAAGMQYTLLDDYHFKAAGLTQNALHGYFITEDNGSLISVFPGSEKLRYTIPFADPQDSIQYLREVGELCPGAVVPFGDDGEKFGVWPDTKVHVYDNGWLRQFFDALVENESWLETITPSDALREVAPLGKLFIPEGSYREMTEWALPSARIEAFDALHHEFEAEGIWHKVAPFIRGGYWRNFKVKYPETNEMYTRMLQVSRRVAEADANGLDADTLGDARRELYRGQCNCAYWHGAFGGIYLPHLRNAIFNHLIAAENILDASAGRGGSANGSNFIESSVEDFNLDARKEVRLTNNKLVSYLAPATGGMMYELDVRSICLNLLSTLARRHEGYHHKVLSGPNAGGDNVASIHDRVVFKQANLDQKIQYDTYQRKSLIDHFFELGATGKHVAAGNVMELGDFVTSAYDAKVRTADQQKQVLLSREGNAAGVPIRLTKGVTLREGSSEIEIAYMLEHLPQDTPLHLAVEFNFAAMPSGLDDRYFHDPEGNRLGHLGEILDLDEQQYLGLTDEWLGIDASLTIDRATGFWTFPIETVSQSEGGFELVHQSTVVMPHWIVLPDANGTWSVTMRMNLDTSMAEQRMQANRISEACV